MILCRSIQLDIIGKRCLTVANVDPMPASNDLNIDVFLRLPRLVFMLLPILEMAGVTLFVADFRLDVVF